jgi:xylan 1,4-beta-xylosidase
MRALYPITWMLAAALVWVRPLAAATPPDAKHLTVDFARTRGEFKSLQGVDGGPLPLFDHPWPDDAPSFLRLQPADVTLAYIAARVDLVRTHDSMGAGDVDSRFGPPGDVPQARQTLDIFPRMDLDPDKASSYNFGPTDRLIASIVDLNADVIFRIGRSAGAQADPPDPDKYAAIARHMVMHYNRGWAQGFHYGIRYWEVWNEPDLGKVFWSGTPQQFYTLYAKVARAVKRADPNAEVGGPALSEAWQQGPYWSGFLEYVKAHGLPLDFFSWHHYSVDADDPLDFVLLAEKVRRVLDLVGFRRTKSFVDEWNYGLIGHDLDATVMQRAAFVASANIYMQDAPIDRSVLYFGSDNFGPTGLRADRVGQVMIALGRMEDAPIRLAASGGDRNGFAVEAGRSADGRTVEILISNYEIPRNDRKPRPGGDAQHIPGLGEIYLMPRRTVTYGDNQGYSLDILHLPSGRYILSRYRIAADADFRLMQRVSLEAPIHVDSNLAAPGVELLVISRAE